MMTSIPVTRPAADRRPKQRAPLLVPVIAYAALTVAAVIVNRSTPHPDASGLAVLTYDRAHATAIRVGSFLLFASAVPLTVATAAAYRRLRALGVAAPGSAITLAGGVLAAGALMMSGLFGWVGGHLGAGATGSLARALADLSFLTGGPGFAVALALAITGISVPGLLGRLLPRPLALIGVALGAVGALSTLTLVNLDFGPALPVVRFGGTIWLIVAAALLGRGRKAHES
jgi:hypothetical protein